MFHEEPVKEVATLKEPVAVIEEPREEAVEEVVKEIVEESHDEFINLDNLDFRLDNVKIFSN